MNTKTKIATLVLATLLPLLTVCAQEVDEPINAKNEMGLNTGYTTGFGFSYRHWFNRCGIQTTAIPIKIDNDFYGSLGITGLYSLKRKKYVSTYLYLGNHIYLNDYRLQFDPFGSSQTEENDKRLRYNIGFGPGFSFGRTVTFSLMVGYAVYDITDKVNLLPTVEYGIYYMF